MKTPHAILIGLSFIASVIYFKDSGIKPAHAFGGPDHIACADIGICYAFEGDIVKPFYWGGGVGYNNARSIRHNWKTGKMIK